MKANESSKEQEVPSKATDKTSGLIRGRRFPRWRHPLNDSLSQFVCCSGMLKRSQIGFGHNCCTWLADANFKAHYSTCPGLPRCLCSRNTWCSKSLRFPGALNYSGLPSETQHALLHYLLGRSVFIREDLLLLGWPLNFRILPAA